MNSPIGISDIEELEEVADFFNSRILGLPLTVNVRFAPSLIGWLYLVGQNGGTMLGMALFVVLAYGTWVALVRSRLQCKAVAGALFLTQLLILAADGVLEGAYLQVLAGIAAITVVEVLLRLTIARPFGGNLGIGVKAQLTSKALHDR